MRVLITGITGLVGSHLADYLLGLDDAKLRYFHEGRYKQLSQFGGEVIRPLVA